MAYDGTFTKQSTEGFAISMSFATNCLVGGETIDSYTVAATKVSDGTSATATVIDASGNAEAAGVVTTFVQGGTTGESYRITFTATTDSGPAAVYVADVLMNVADT